MIVSLVTVEIFKVVQGYTSLDDLLRSQINLALLNLSNQYSPDEPRQIKGGYDEVLADDYTVVPGPWGKESFSEYAKLEVDVGSIDCETFNKYLADAHNIVVSNLWYQGTSSGLSRCAVCGCKVDMATTHKVPEATPLPAQAKAIVAAAGAGTLRAGDMGVPL